LETKGLPQLVGVASIIVILAGLKAAEAIVIPMLLALFIAIISTPFLRLMISKGVPSSIAIVIVLLVLLTVGGLLATVVTQSINTFLERMPEYQSKLQNTLIGILPLLENMHLPIDRQTLLESINPSSVMGVFGQALTMLKSILTSTFLVLFIVIFILMEEATFSNKLKIALPKANETIDTATNFIKRVNKYILIKSTISLITGILITLWLLYLDVDFPVLWGLIAILMNFIPNIGSLIAAIPAVLLAFVQLGIGDAAMVALGYLIINVTLGNLIEPRLMGKGLGLSPLVVFLSLITWGWLFGIVGMFLSIPLTMIVKIALEQNPGTLWIAILLGNEPPSQKDLPKQSAKRLEEKSKINTL